MVVENNTFAFGRGIGVYLPDGPGLEVRNNIVDGLCKPLTNADYSLSNNLHLRRCNLADEEMGEGSRMFEGDLDGLFEDTMTDDFRPIPGSVACDMADDGGHVGALPCR